MLDILCEQDDAFSLHRESGKCDDLLIKFKLTGKGGFYIRPYDLSSSEKIVVDRELESV